MESLWQLSERRLIDVNLGIAISTLVSIFIAPERSIDAIRNLELEAFTCGVDAFRSGAAALAGALSEDAPTADQTFCIGLHTQAGPLHELRKRIKTCMDKIDFGGDGLPGVGDMLSDARWELRIGAEGGSRYFKGLLWLPTCCHRQSHARLPGRLCLKVVPLLHRLLRQSYTLLALSEGVRGGEGLLHDSRIAVVLGSDGGRLADPVAAAIKALPPLLVDKEPERDGQDMGDDEAPDEIASNLELARSGLRLLIDEAAAIRAQSDKIGSFTADSQKAVAIVVTMEAMLSSFDLLDKLLRGSEEETETSEEETGDLS